MDYPERKDLFSDRLFRKLIDYLYLYRYMICGSLLMGLMAYAFAFTNKLPNHDDVAGLFTKGVGIESGRFGITALGFLFPNFSMPWIYGIGSLVLLTMGNCLIVKLFQIRSPLLQFLLGGLIITFPSQTATFSYLFTAFPYAIAYWLAVLAVDLVSRSEKKYILPGVLALVGSLSIYQAYVSITAALLILLLMRKLILDEGSVRELFVQGIVYVFFLVGALGFYWLLSNLLWTVTGYSMGNYASNAVSFRLSDIPANIKLAYINCIRVLRYRHHGLIISDASVAVHLALVGFSALELLLYVLRTRDLPRTLLLGFLGVVLPLAINCLFLMVSSDSIHTLVLFSYTTLYVLFAFLVEAGQLRTLCFPLADRLHKACLNLCILAFAWILAGNVFLANEASLSMHLSYENTYALAVSTLAQLNTIPEYTPESPVVILGEHPGTGYSSRFLHSRRLMGVGGLSPDMYSMNDFFRYYVGVPINLVGTEDYLQSADPYALAQIPVYPNKGFISQVGNTFVIKLSETWED